MLPEQLRCLPHEPIVIEICNSICHDVPFYIESSVLIQRILGLHKLIVLVKLPSQVGCVNPSIGYSSDVERILQQLWPVPIELLHESNRIKGELVIILREVNVPLGN